MSQKLQILKKLIGSFWTTGEEHLFKCPKCDHHKHKLSVNISKSAFKCWVCNYSGNNLSHLVRKYGNKYYSDWLELEGSIDISKYDSIFEENLSEDVVESVELPPGFKTLTGPPTPLKERALKLL